MPDATEKKGKPKRKPSLRARKALDIMSENGGNMGKAMLEAGYSKITSKTPQKLTESLGFKELMAERLNDELLAKVHSEGLEAYRTVITEDGDEEIPDFAVRHKYLETAYKIRDKMPKEAPPIPPVAIQINNVIEIDAMAEEIAARLKDKKINEPSNQGTISGA